LASALHPGRRVVGESGNYSRRAPDCAENPRRQKSLVDVVHEGGRHVLAGSGLVLKALPLVAVWNTDREEHNLITRAHPHTYFHCKVPAHLKDTVGEWPLMDSTNVKDMIENANTTGEYGGDKWRLKYAARSQSPRRSLSWLPRPGLTGRHITMW